MLTIHKKYFLLALILFFVEVLIAMYVQDSFVRPYGGDFLVVIFLYCLQKSFFKIPVKNAIIWVLLFAFLVEGLQYFHLIKVLGLEGNRVASTVLGSHFEWLDMLLYTLAAGTIFLAESLRIGLKKNGTHYNK